MKHLIASLLTIGSLTPLFWFDVVPHGQELCNSSTEFATLLGTDTQRAAAAVAKSKFCSVVAGHAI